MADDQTAEIAPEATIGDAPEATTTEPATIADDVTADGPESDAAEATSPHDRKLRSENQSLRKRLRDLEAQVKAREEAELSEQERMQRRMIELETQIETTRSKARDVALRAEIANRAATLGIVDVDAASRLLDLDALEYDDDAEGWIGVDDALRALTQDRPWLISTAAPAGSGANPTNPPRRRARVTREALSKMTQSEIDALPWEDVQAALAEQ